MARFSASTFLLLAVLFAASASAKVLNLTDETFDSTVADKEKTFFIKFYAPWCGHCKRLAPTWEELSEELANDSKIVIAHVDCTAAKDTCTKAEIRGYPTLEVFHNGKRLDKYQGGRDIGSLKTYIINLEVPATAEVA